MTWPRNPEGGRKGPSPAGRLVLRQLLDFGGFWLRGACGSMLVGREQVLVALEDRGYIVIEFGAVLIDGHPFQVVERVTITEKGRAAFPLRAPQ